MDINDLEAKVDQLISLVDALEEKHAHMLADKEIWVAERATLIEKNELARSKVEGMILRLKSLEQG